MTPSSQKMRRLGKKEVKIEGKWAEVLIKEVWDCKQQEYFQNMVIILFMEIWLSYAKVKKGLPLRLAGTL